MANRGKIVQPVGDIKHLYAFEKAMEKALGELKQMSVITSVQDRVVYKYAVRLDDLRTERRCKEIEART